MQLAMSVYYNWDVTKKKEKDKKHHYFIAALSECPTWLGPTLKLATIVDMRGTSVENAQKGDSPGESPGSHWDLALSAKVTTGGLSAPISRWKVGCHLLWIDGTQGLLSSLYFLTSMLGSLRQA
jgi:hypothetical protein